MEFKVGYAITEGGYPAYIQSVDLATHVIKGAFFNDSEWMPLIWYKDGTCKAAGKDSDLNLESNIDLEINK